MSKISIRPHSAVRIKPVKSTIKVAIKLRLQPLNAMVRVAISVRSDLFRKTSDPKSNLSNCIFFICQPEEDDEEIQSVFLGWLHTKSHEPLGRLTPRSGTILLHGNDGDLIFIFIR